MAMYTLKAAGDVTTASTTLVIKPQNIEMFDKFSITYKNQMSAAMKSMNVEVATDTLGTASSLDFYQLTTAIIPAPSALGDSAVVITSAIENSWKWLRIYCHSSATAATTQKLTIAITGQRG
ncbi:MAG: hypothetical protein CMC15_15075 [Flavobacteriaceae bacterium]|mgnify:CR=1 FL=1|nr:hypothetical protein [Flavobacteriaceae bacterium]